MTDRDLMLQALGALKMLLNDDGRFVLAEDAVQALRTRLAQPEPTKIHDCPRCHCHFIDDGEILSQSDGKSWREWQGLTDEEITGTDALGIYAKPLIEFARAIEAKLKEKNNG